MAFNSYLFEREGGCIAIDPLPLDPGSIEQIRKLGGVKKIVLTNRDHERDAAAVRETFGATILASESEAPLFSTSIDETFKGGAELFSGAYAVTLPHGKTAGEIAIYFPFKRAAVVGDALIGAPAGELSLLPNEKLADKKMFVLTLRKLWGFQLSTLLLCDGQPIFGNADAAIGKLLHAAGGPEIYRMNADEIAWSCDEDGVFSGEDGEVGLPIGSRKIGYRLAKIAPGKAFCPLHWHVACEEFFYVIEGRPTIRALDGEYECRPGDFIAFPTGESGAHQVINRSDEPALVLLVGMEETATGLEICFYPDSDKVGMWTTAERLRMLRATPDLDYFDGESKESLPRK